MSRSPINGLLGAFAVLLLACGGGADPKPDAGLPIPDGSEPTANRAPIIELGSHIVLLEGEVRSLAFTRSDPDGDAVTVSFADLPEWITREGDALRFAPQAGHAGEYAVTATASDGALTATDTLAITVQTAPTGTLRINAGAGYTRDTRVSVQLEVIPGAGASALTEVAFSRDGVSFDEATPFAPAFADVQLEAATDGLKTLWARVRDDAGHEAVLSAQVMLDRVAPAVEVNAPSWVRGSTAELSISASDASPIDEVCFSNDGVAFSGCGMQLGAASWTLTAGDGLKTVTVRAVDAAGNVGFGEVQLTLDTVAPTGSVSITDGKTATRERQVDLTLAVSDAVSGAVSMAFSVDGGASWTATVPSASHALVELPDADTSHPLSARVTDGAGNVATFEAGSILLDRVAPLGSLSVVEVGSHGFVGTRSVSVALTFSDVGSGVSAMAFANDAEEFGSWAPVQSSRAWTLNDVEGTRTLWMRLSDVAGNTIDVQTTVKLDTTGPTGTLTLEGGAPWTTTPAITLHLAATDLGGSGLFGMCVKNVASPPTRVDTCWRTYDTLLAHTLEPGDGGKTVHVYLRDQLGNLGHLSASISLDTMAPMAVIEDVTMRSRTVQVRWAEASDPSGITGYELCYRDLVDAEPRCESVGMALEHTLAPVPNGRRAIVTVATTDGAGHRRMSAELEVEPDFTFRETQRLPTSNTLHDIHVRSAQEQIAVGERGQIFTTTDRWTTVTRVDPMVDVDLYAVAGDGNTVHAVGANGTIVISTDRGARWRRSSGPTQALRDVAVVQSPTPAPTRRWVAVGDNGTVATLDRSPTPSCGSSCPQDQWQVQSLPEGSTLRSVAASPETGVVIAVGDNGVIQRSSDQGTSWTQITSPLTSQLTSVTWVPGGSSFYAVSATGKILLGSGGGLTWTVLTGLTPALPTGGTLRAVQAVAGGRLYLAHDAGSGTSRIYELTTATLAVRPVWSLSQGVPRGLGSDGDPGRLTVVGTVGLIQSSLDAMAATPTTVTPTRGTSETFQGLAPGWTGSIIWAVGGGGTTVYDTANGAQWTPQMGPSTTIRRGVAVLPSGVAFAVGNGGSVWRSAPPTSAWSEVGAGSFNLRSVSCVSNVLCYAVGSTEGIVEYNGSAWIIDFSDPVSTGLYVDVATYLDTSSRVRGIAITHDGRVRTNLDQVWTHRMGVSASNLTAVAARPSGVAVMVGENGLLYRSSNHGVSWTHLPGAVGTVSLHDVLWARDDVWFAAGASGLVFRSDDNGQTWTSLQTNSTRSFLALGHRALGVGSELTDLVWAAGADGTILRSVTGGR